MFSFHANNLTLNLPEIKRGILVNDYIIPTSTSHLHISQYSIYIYIPDNFPSIYLTISHLYTSQFPIYIPHNFPSINTSQFPSMYIPIVIFYFIYEVCMFYCIYLCFCTLWKLNKVNTLFDYLRLPNYNNLFSDFKIKHKSFF